jgi:hypothetical protein
VSLEVGGVDHQPVRLAAPGGQHGEDLVECPKPALADEPIIDGLVRAVVRGRVAPARPFLITKIIPLITLRPSTRAMPWDSEK